MKSLVFLPLFLLYACTETKQAELPFSDDRLIELMMDVHISEAAVQKHDKTQRDSMHTILWSQITKMYNFESVAALDSLLQRIQKDPISFAKIETKVTTILDSLSSRVIKE